MTNSSKRKVHVLAKIFYIEVENLVKAKSLGAADLPHAKI